MALLADQREKGATLFPAQKALELPFGMASPLWLAFGAATTAGVAWWWMTRWTRALNIEAQIVSTQLVPTFVPSAEPAVAAVEHVAEVAIEAIETPIAATEEVVEAVLEAEPEAPVGPDDLTRLTGIGAKLADALAARGVTRFAQLAAWTEEDLARIDADLKLLGRAVRNDWVGQAQRMLSAEA